MSRKWVQVLPSPPSQSHLLLIIPKLLSGGSGTLQIPKMWDPAEIQLQEEQDAPS